MVEMVKLEKVIQRASHSDLILILELMTHVIMTFQCQKTAGRIFKQFLPSQNNSQN